jgi:hypothetical protein
LWVINAVSAIARDVGFAPDRCRERGYSPWRRRASNRREQVQQYFPRPSHAPESRRRVPQDICAALAIEIADAGDLEIAGMRTEINAAGPLAVVHQLLVEVAGRGVVLLIEQMKFTIKKLRHERFGQSLGTACRA